MTKPIKAALFSVLLLLFLACENKEIVDQIDSPRTEIIQTAAGLHLDSILSPYILKLRDLTDNQAGLAVGITKGDEIIYAKTFGYENIETGKEANLNTVFHIASVSKPFTAVAITKLIQQGKLTLDDKLIDHIPNFEMKGEHWENITIKHVLTHTSGIPRHISSGEWENPAVGDTAMDYNLKNLKEFELDFEPGTEYDYSNSGFDILGSLVEEVSGVRFHEYLQSHVLKPAGMNNTFYIKPVNELPENWAVPYSYSAQTQEWSPYPYSENYFPSSGVQTTVLDMCQWGILHLNQGTFGTHSILDKEYFEMLVTPYFETPWGDQIGLSWYLQSYMDHPNIMHLGNDTGFGAFTCIYPEDDISITIMGSRDFSKIGRMVNAASEVLFGEEPKDYSISAQYPFGKAYLEGGIEMAKKVWQKLEADTTDIYFTDIDDILTCGAVYEAGKDYDMALPVLEYYLELDTQSTYATRLLANCHLNLGDTTTAVSTYLRCLEINPEYSKAKDALDLLGFTE